ncbi:hypothetical protein Cni_G01821 [Canna indica]|uniref:Nodulin-like domain-containing protein n=1 Tax=Canna indica TaxID=4628 RepID=A0AAQ3PZ78_9LILI|nr:hypothetical protein Cni_G01821 [Canna indica]
MMGSYDQRTLNTISFFKDLDANVGVLPSLINEVAPPSTVLAVSAAMNLFGYLMKKERKGKGELAPLHRSTRVFAYPSSYEFDVKNKDTHLIRLHFYPFSIQEYNLSSARFHVLASGIILSSDFGTYSPLLKEYLINLEEEKRIITFAPADRSSLAFVNAIVVVSAPKGLILYPARLVRFDDVTKFDGLSKYAPESLYSFNVGGPNVTLVHAFLETGGRDTPFAAAYNEGVPDLDERLDDDTFEEWDRTATNTVRELMNLRVDMNLFHRMLIELRVVGFNAGICKVQWDTSDKLVARSCKYIDVVVAATSGKETRYIVDLDFTAKFEVARATEEYKAMVATVPRVAGGEDCGRRALLVDEDGEDADIGAEVI